MTLSIGDIASCAAVLVASIGVWAVFVIDARQAERARDAERRAVQRDIESNRLADERSVEAERRADERAQVLEQKRLADASAVRQQLLVAYADYGGQAIEIMRHELVGNTTQAPPKITPVQNALKEVGARLAALDCPSPISPEAKVALDRLCYLASANPMSGVPFNANDWRNWLHAQIQRIEEQLQIIALDRSEDT